MTTAPDQAAYLSDALLHLPRVTNPLTLLHDALVAEDESLHVLIRQCPDRAEKEALGLRLNNVWVAKHALRLCLNELKRLKEIKLP